LSFGWFAFGIVAANARACDGEWWMYEYGQGKVKKSMKLFCGSRWCFDLVTLLDEDYDNKPVKIFK
jgi:hypothetical protein